MLLIMPKRKANYYKRLEIAAKVSKSASQKRLQQRERSFVGEGASHRHRECDTRPEEYSKTSAEKRK